MPRKKNICFVPAKLVSKSSGHSQQQETQWHYDLPNFQQPIVSIAISLDGTCMHLSKEGWREAMAGTISFYDAKGERQHTVYLGATPEYGKADFLRRFTAEIERVKAHFPNAKRVGLADGAESNWQFLTPHTQTQILDFYHASSYLGAVANAKYPKDKSAHKAWLEDRCHQLKHTAGAAETLYDEMVALQARKCTKNYRNIYETSWEPPLPIIKIIGTKWTTSVTPSKIFRLARV